VFNTIFDQNPRISTKIRTSHVRVAGVRRGRSPSRGAGAEPPPDLRLLSSSAAQPRGPPPPPAPTKREFLRISTKIDTFCVFPAFPTQNDASARSPPPTSCSHQTQLRPKSLINTNERPTTHPLLPPDANFTVSRPKSALFCVFRVYSTKCTHPKRTSA